MSVASNWHEVICLSYGYMDFRKFFFVCYLHFYQYREALLAVHVNEIFYPSPSVANVIYVQMYDKLKGRGGGGLAQLPAPIGATSFSYSISPSAL